MKRIVELDGLRGCAILMVLVHHSADLDLLHIFQHTIAYKVFWHLAKSLWIGVDVFFVLSGFLITSILVRTKSQISFLSHFYQRRAVRILPMFLLVLGVVYLLGVTTSPTYIPGSFAITAISLGNWLPTWGAEIPMLSHFWSLAVEEQYYVFWPFVVYFVSRAKLPSCCLSLVAAATILRIVMVVAEVEPYAIYKGTFSHMDGLAFGSLLAASPGLEGFKKRARLVFSVSVAGLLMVAILDGGALYAFSPLCLAVGLPLISASTFILTGAVLTGGYPKLNALLRTPLLRSAGTYSYAIYLLHVPILNLLNHWFPAGTSVSAAHWLVPSLYFIGPTAIAWLTWRLIERPFLALGRN